jgi:hypothetical protein
MKAGETEHDSPHHLTSDPRSQVQVFYIFPASGSINTLCALRGMDLRVPTPRTKEEVSETDLEMGSSIYFICFTHFAFILTSYSRQITDVLLL